MTPLYGFKTASALTHAYGLFVSINQRATEVVPIALTASGSPDHTHIITAPASPKNARRLLSGISTSVSSVETDADNSGSRDAGRITERRRANG